MNGDSDRNSETSPMEQGFAGERTATWMQRIRNLLRACFTEVLLMLHLAVLYLLDSIGLFQF